MYNTYVIAKECFEYMCINTIATVNHFNAYKTVMYANKVVKKIVLTEEKDHIIEVMQWDKQYV